MESRSSSQRTLRVLHIAAWYPTPAHPVAGVFILEHVRATALYANVAVVYAERNRRIGFKPHISDSLEHEIRTLRISYPRLPFPKSAFLSYAWSILAAYRYLRSRRFKPDIIHAHVWYAGAAGLLLARLHRRPLLVTEHASVFPRRLLKPRHQRIARKVFHSCHRVCPVSEYLAKYIREIAPHSRITVVPNVIDTTLFTPTEAPPAPPQTTKRILVVALLSPIKGINHLLDALAQLRTKRTDFVLDILGDGPARSDLELQTARLGLADVVRFHGLKSKAEVAAFMRECSFLVHPSLCETFGIAPIEALSIGKPVLATTVGIFPEIVTPDCGLLVPPGDTQALAAAVDRMLDHHAEFNVLGAAAALRNKFSRETVGHRYTELYHEALTAQENAPSGPFLRALSAIRAAFRNLKGATRTWARILARLRGATTRDELSLCLSACIDLCDRLFHPAEVRNPRCALPCTVRDTSKSVVFRIRPGSDDIYSVLPRREGPVETAIFDLLGLSDTFVDVGANVGYYTVLAAKRVGPMGHVIAVEAFPDTANSLKTNLALNCLNNVRIVQAAAWSESGRRRTFHFQPGHWGQVTLCANETSESSVQSPATVPTERLDDICAAVPHIRVLKLDIEGAEYEALKGAAATLAKTQRVVLECSNDEEAIMDLLRRHGFRIQRLPFSTYIQADK
ncbi:FkbM family methyltransferase [Limisphaera sp. VF-2]|uniref:FkbM family methyltransferase n=1 Tax=Limisphaera sp. VF-2 TaxID=3400418 RepID=UPI003C274DF3